MYCEGVGIANYDYTTHGFVRITNWVDNLTFGTALKRLSVGDLILCPLVFVNSF